MLEPNIGDSTADTKTPRREFMACSTVAMAGGLVAGYGTLAVFAGRYLYPARPREMIWMYVTKADRMQPGEAIDFVDPTGAKIVIACRSADQPGGDKTFVALSSVCPHLGCQVRWEPHNDRFFCPCHNGVFDPQGKALEGPPAAENQSLAHYELKVNEEGLLFIRVPVEGLTSAAEA